MTDWPTALARCVTTLGTTGTARALGVSVQSVTDWRAGRRRPTPEHQEAIVALLSRTVAELSPPHPPTAPE
jgi:DNA-binding transcriptional regulator YiaG